MIKKLLLPLILIISLAVNAQTMVPSDAGSTVKFTIKNFGLNVDGSLKGLQGKIVFQPENLASSKLSVTLDAGTINTGNGSRDKHLKQDDYFDVAKYPTLQFVSTSITRGDKTGSYHMAGLLTIKGTPKSVSFPFTATATADGYQFAGSFSINRRDFKVGGGSLVLSDVLTISLNVAAKK